MKIAITGASGTIGRQLVPLLTQRGFDLVLFGRNPSALERTFPGHSCFANEHLSSAARGCDALVHLAVLNNDARAHLNEFYAVNVAFLEQMLAAARDAGVKCFVNMSSTHVLERRTDAYTTSKRAAAQLVSATSGIAGVNLYCAKFYGTDSARVTAHPLLWKMLSAVKPTVELNQLADCIQNAILQTRSQEIICTAPQRDNKFYSAGQFLIDMSISAAVIVLLGWLMVLISIAIRFNSPGPAIFAQTRVGQNADPFTCYKFRTMQVGTRQAGTHEISTTAVTSVGNWLRRTKLDELPQVWNILRREMSFVGPRPCLPTQIKLVEERRIRDVYDIKPGITGLAQINDIDMSSPAILAEWDARYVALQSIWTDLRIILLTIVGRGSGDRTTPPP